MISLKNCDVLTSIRMTIINQTKLLGRVNNLDEVFLQAGAPNKRAVNIRALCEFPTVGGGDGAAVKNPGGVGHFLADLLRQPAPDCLVHLLCLCRGRCLPRPDCPDRLVGQHHAGPVSDVGFEGGQLPEHDLGQRLS